MMTVVQAKELLRWEHWHHPSRCYAEAIERAWAFWHTITL